MVRLRLSLGESTKQTPCIGRLDGGTAATRGGDAGGKGNGASRRQSGDQHGRHERFPFEHATYGERLLARSARPGIVGDLTFTLRAPQGFHGSRRADLFPFDGHAEHSPGHVGRCPHTERIDPDPWESEHAFLRPPGIVDIGPRDCRLAAISDPGGVGGVGRLACRLPAGSSGRVPSIAPVSHPRAPAYV
jgi:hypothetical protein